MSFLSSHRLHWGVHHELSDNFWVQIERMVHDPVVSADPQTSHPVISHTEICTPGVNLPPNSATRGESSTSS